MISKPILPFIELMSTQVCNLSCQGCTNYSDLKHKGYVKWEDAKQQLEQWLKIVDIPDIGIMGGEPLINPQIRNWIIGIRELMPNSQIRFSTNGLLLHKHMDIISLMHSLGNVVFKITVHTIDDQLRDVIEDILTRYKWRIVLEHGIARWKTSNNIRFQLNYPTEFVKTFQGPYKDMKPYKSSPDTAFKTCIQQTCPLLYNGRIHKCSTAGLLKDTLEHLDNPNIELWNKYIDDGISITDDINTITAFIDNFGKPNKLCAQCPSVIDTNSIIKHNESTVKFK